MISILKEFGRGQVTLPKSWRERFDTQVYIAKETSQGLLIVPLEDESIQIDEARLRSEASAGTAKNKFKKKSIRKEK